MGISANPTGDTNPVDTPDVSSLQREISYLRSRLEHIQLENGSLNVELKRANKVIKVLSDRSCWFESLLAHVSTEDGSQAKYN